MWRMFKGDELVDIASEGGQTTLDGVTRQVRRRDSASYVARRAAARRPDGGRFQNLISGGVFYRSQVLRSLPGSDATVAISEVFHATGAPLSPGARPRTATSGVIRTNGWSVGGAKPSLRAAELGVRALFEQVPNFSFIRKHSH